MYRGDKPADSLVIRAEATGDSAIGWKRCIDIVAAVSHLRSRLRVGAALRALTL
jgi:hypothetical protein